MKIFTIVFLFYFSISAAQEHGIDSKNLLHGEIVGNSDDVISLNYERNHSISNNSKLRLAERIGLGISFVDQAKDSMTVRLNVPIEALLLYGKHNNIEFGVGLTSSFGKAFTNELKNPPKTYKNYEYTYCLRLGYRYIADGGFVFRAAPMLIFPHVQKSEAVVGFALSFGYAL